MYTKTFSFLIALGCLYADETALENLVGTEIQQCLNCLCHAMSGCWSRYNCAKYTITLDYWKDAGSPSLGGSNEYETFGKCIANENCILNTIKRYTEYYGPRDCNCDGDFDCKDRLAIHMFGEFCHNPDYGLIYSRRFNECAQETGVSNMAAQEGVCDEAEFLKGNYSVLN